MNGFDWFVQSGKTDIDIKVYEGLWKDYFGSDDVNAAGNSIFGKVSFPWTSYTSILKNVFIIPYTTSQLHCRLLLQTCYNIGVNVNKNIFSRHV